MSASLAVQKLVVAALASIDGIGGVFDGPAPDAVPPYLVVGPDLVTEWGSKSFDGHEHRIGVTVWDAGPGTVRAKQLMGAVEARLAALAGVADGHRIATARLVRTLVLTDPQGWTQGLVEFRVRSVTDTHDNI
jgi:hypothetical protein